MANPLSFYLGEETHFIIEKYQDREVSIFAEQYTKALHLIDKYIDATSNLSNPYLQELCNNIIAFIGDRGTGKTSCMMSVLNMIDEHLLQHSLRISTAKIEMVDPSFFNDNTNIIYLVVGKMFAAFKDAIDNRKWKISECIVNDLISSFSTLLPQLSLMEKSPLNEDDTDLRQLGNLSIVVDLKQSLKSLIDCYLKFFEKDYLVIPVDDIDNNIVQANLMMEQIRKYLILPNVIILISFDIEQLQNVLELHFTKLYEPLLSNNKFKTESITDMANKYLLKLFPLEHRIALPILQTMMEKELEVYDRRNGKKLILSGSSMKYTMTALIFKKTRYLFYHSTGETSLIVPTNLREYRSLLSLLCNMDDYSESQNAYNKQQFRNYFFGEWVDKHLNADGCIIAKQLIDNTEPSKFNKILINLLSDYWKKLGFSPQIFQNDEYKYILERDNQAYNVSIGDAFAVLNIWKDYIVSEKDKALLFFVESLYSIKLYHYYDEITEPDIIQASKNATIDDTIKRLDQLEHVTNYAKLIGGAFFNPKLFPLLPIEKKTNKSRSYRVIDIKPLRDLLLAQSEINDNSFFLAEFFALTLSRKLEGKTKEYLAPFYRTIPEVYYRSDMKKSQKAVFDLASFFVSIIDIRFAYDRIIPDFYNKAEQREGSLLNKLKELTKSKYRLEEYENDRFLSWTSIRNAVFLEELGNSFRYVKTNRTQSSDQIELLKDFFEQVFDFRIKTYDRRTDNSAYDIRFDFAKVFVTFFEEIGNDEEAKELFSKVFDSEQINLPINEITKGLLKRVRKHTLKKRIVAESNVTLGMSDFWDEFDKLITTQTIEKNKVVDILNILKNKFE